MYMFFVFYNIDILKEYSLHLFFFHCWNFKNLRYNSIISHNSSLKVYNSVVFVIFVRLWNLLSHSGTFSLPSPEKYLEQSLPIPPYPPPALATTNIVSVSMDLPILDISKNRIIQYVNFYILFPSVSMFLRFMLHCEAVLNTK